MNIAIIGASGYVGSAILDEALRRQHDVTAVVRNVGKVAALELQGMFLFTAVALALLGPGRFSINTR